jgi:iron(III) transport system permease protein
VSRPLVLLALAVFTLACIAPLVVMAARVTPADLADLADPRTLALLGRTIGLGLGVAGLALVLGLPFGFLVARTDLPGAAWLRPLGVAPLLLPPLILAMTWAVVLPDLRGPAAAILLLGVSSFPLVAIFSARAFERVDARLGEAALLCGGRSAALRLELPLVLPAAAAGACLAFAFAANDFAVPDYLSSVGPKFNVYADEIKLNWDQFHRPGKAVATALPLVAVTLVGLLPALALRRRGALASLVGDFRPPEPLRLGPWRWPAFAFALALVSLGCLVPLARLVFEAAAGPKLLAEGGADPLDLVSQGFATLRAEFGRALELARGDLANSVVFGLEAALVCVPLGLVLGHAIERARSRTAGRALEVASLLPIAAPAVLFGIGIVALWNRAWSAGFYDSGAMAAWLFVGRYSAFAVLIASGAVASLDPALEEAAALSGARPARRLGWIVAPSVRGSLVASFVLVLVFAMRDLDAAILVPAANRTAVIRVYNGVHFGRDSYVAALSLLLVFAILLPGLLWSLFARRRLEVLP